MERSLHVVGIDEDGVDRLALVLSQTADQLSNARADLVGTFTAVGRVSDVPAHV